MSDVYHKINAPFLRDKQGKLIDGAWCLQELEYLAGNRWQFTEKVDGTNIRIDIHRQQDFLWIYINGKTDNAQIPKPLMDALNGIFGGSGQEFRNTPTDRHPLTDEIGKIMVDRDITALTIYGEGYGPKINNGGNYGESPSFVVFDIKVGDFWLTRDSVNDFCSKVGLDSVPVIGYGTLYDAIDIVQTGYANQQHYDGGSVECRLKSQWGDFEAEGIIAVPVVPLFTRAGNRVITKIKGRDFP